MTSENEVWHFQPLIFMEYDILSKGFKDVSFVQLLLNTFSVSDIYRKACYNEQTQNIFI
jgi:hypothetical protein